MHTPNQQTQHLNQPQQQEYPRQRPMLSNFSKSHPSAIKQQASHNSLLATPEYSNPFACNICNLQAHSPVVSSCGHIYCWKCVCKEIQVDVLVCRVCSQHMQIDHMRPIYVSGEEHAHTDMPSQSADPTQATQCISPSQLSRPKPRNSNPILNPTNIARTDSYTHYQNLVNNIGNRKSLGGVAVSPSIAILALSSVSSQRELRKKEEQEREADRIRRERARPQSGGTANSYSQNNNQNYIENMLDENINLANPHNSNICSDLPSSPTQLQIKDIQYFTSKLQTCLCISFIIVVIGIILMYDAI